MEAQKKDSSFDLLKETELVTLLNQCRDKMFASVNFSFAKLLLCFLNRFYQNCLKEKVLMIEFCC